MFVFAFNFLGFCRDKLLKLVFDEYKKGFSTNFFSEICFNVCFDC